MTQRDSVALSIERGTSERFIGSITEQVHAIDRQLAWELTPGSSSRHCLVVTAEGNQAAIAAAYAWLAAAPPPDQLWSYLAMRPPQPLRVMEIGSWRIDLKDVRSRPELDEGAERLNVVLWHPGFADMPPDLQFHVARLFLDALAGEEGAARWIGSVVVGRVAAGGMTASELLGVIQRLRKASTGAKWALFARATADGRVVLTQINTALKRIDHPLATWHAVVNVEAPLAFDPAIPDVSGDDALIREIERAGATYVGKTVDRFRRRLHFVFVAGAQPAQALRRWAASYAGRATVELTDDPGWGFIADLTGDAVRA
jgi:hypothetical protein